MTATLAHIVLLLERIKEELKHEEDKAVLQKYLDKIKCSAWAETIRELFG